MRLQNKTIKVWEDFDSVLLSLISFFCFKVSYARPSSETIKGANLYICGIRLEVQQAELESMFTPFGTIISSKILTDPKSGI